MSNIILKTAKRNTSVPRLTIRKAVEAVYAGIAAAPAAKPTPAVAMIEKKPTPKKHSR